MRGSLGIVIPCLNEPESVVPVLTRVDNSPDSRIYRTIRNFSEVIESDPLLFFCNPSNNLGLARKLIVEKASCDWLAFTDGDCVVPKNWLKGLVDLAESQKSPHLAAVGGGQDWPEKGFQKAQTCIRFVFGTSDEGGDSPLVLWLIGIWHCCIRSLFSFILLIVT